MNFDQYIHTHTFVYVLYSIYISELSVCEKFISVQFIAEKYCSFVTKQWFKYFMGLSFGHTTNISAGRSTRA